MTKQLFSCVDLGEDEGHARGQLDILYLSL